MALAHYLLPQGIDRLDRLPASALPLAGGPLGFIGFRAIERNAAAARDDVVLLPAGLEDPERSGLIQAACRARPPFAGLALGEPRIMGIVNVTPDSFSDGGERVDPGRAVEDGLAMQAAGAAIVDVGGESTRPGAAPVPLEEELARTIPVVAGLARQGVTVSIDTRHARVMVGAIEAGAAIVNDVTALGGEPESLALIADSPAAVILMHMRGEPRTMQADPRYADAPLDVYDYLAERVQACEAAGIARARIAVDPGIGFGKTVSHNLEILDRLALYHGIGCALALGVSRKSFIGRLSSGEPPKERLAGSLAAALAGVRRGVQILRVHDVAETAQALALWQAIDAAAEN